MKQVSNSKREGFQMALQSRFQKTPIAPKTTLSHYQDALNEDLNIDLGAMGNISSPPNKNSM